jgi:hypothetical protein
MGSTVKKFTYFSIAIFLFFIFAGSVLSGALELHTAISGHMQRFDSFHESWSLVLLGSLLITGATVLRRRKAARITR